MTTKERVETQYPACAAATASVTRPASPQATVIAQAVVRAATRSGSSSHARVFDDCLAASGLPIAAQYTVRNASIQARACGGVVCDASSISLFAPAGSARTNSRLVARRKARLAR